MASEFPWVFLGDLVHICTMVKLHRISWDHEWINWDFTFLYSHRTRINVHLRHLQLLSAGACYMRYLGGCFPGIQTSLEYALRFRGNPLAKMELFFREILQETTPRYGRSFRTGSISACFDTSVNDVDGLTKPCTSNLGGLKLASQPSQWGWL